MTTSPLTSSSAATSSSTPLAGKALAPSDFINLMVTQLEHQDPLQPTSSSELLSQMSQIGQLQASTSLQTSLQGMTLQNSISSASSMIGKTVQGLDVNNNPITGLVNSVKVKSDGVSLELDNGQTLDLARVTQIAPGPSQVKAS